MRKFRFYVNWDEEIEAEDEFAALMEADRRFDFIREANSYEIEPQDGESNGE